jgi:hypothetical protein
MAFAPNSLADHMFDGTRNSSALTAMIASAGATARNGSAWRQGSPGRDSARTRPNALAASVIMTTNLNRTRGDSAAIAISGLGPNAAKKAAPARATARPIAPHHTDETEAACRRSSATRALMSSSVSMSRPPESLGDRRQPAMQCYAHRPLAHAKMPGRLADRAPIDANRGHGRALAGREGVKDPANLAIADGLSVGPSRGFWDISYLDLHPASATAVGPTAMPRWRRVNLTQATVLPSGRALRQLARGSSPALRSGPRAAMGSGA